MRGGGSTGEGIGGAAEGCGTCLSALGRGTILEACPLQPFLRDVDAFCDFFPTAWRAVTGDVARGGESVAAPLVPSKEIF